MNGVGGAGKVLRRGFSAAELLIVVTILGFLALIAEPNISWRSFDRQVCQEQQRHLLSVLEMYQLDYPDARIELGPKLWETLVAGGYLQVPPHPPSSRSSEVCPYRLLGEDRMLCPKHGGALGNVGFWRDLHDGKLTQKLREHSLSPPLMMVMEQLEAEHRAGSDQRPLVQVMAVAVILALLIMTIAALAVERFRAGEGPPTGRQVGLAGGAVGLVGLALASLLFLRPNPAPLELASGEGRGWIQGAPEVTWEHLRAGLVVPALERAGVGPDETWLVEEFLHPPASWSYRRNRDAQFRGALWGAIPFLLLFVIWKKRNRP